MPHLASDHPILICVPNPTIPSVCAQAIRNADLEVLLSTSSNQALEFLKCHRFPAVVFESEGCQDQCIAWLGTMVPSIATSRVVFFSSPKETRELCQQVKNLGISKTASFSDLTALIEHCHRAVAEFSLQHFAHQISQPLTTIGNFAMGLTLSLRDSDARYHEFLAILNKIQHEVSRAGELLKQVSAKKR